MVNSLIVPKTTTVRRFAHPTTRLYHDPLNKKDFDKSHDIGDDDLAPSNNEKEEMPIMKRLDQSENDAAELSGTSRRQLLSTACAAGSLLWMASLATNAVESSSPSSLEESALAPSSGLDDISIGTGQWTKLSGRSKLSSQTVPASFCTYTSRILINYDEGVQSWWKTRLESTSLLSLDKQQAELNKSFASLAKSIQLALEQYINTDNNNNANNEKNYQQYQQRAYAQLAQLFIEKYGKNNLEAQRHIGLLFSMLPSSLQPKDILSNLASSSSSSPSLKKQDDDAMLAKPDSNQDLLLKDPSALLPSQFQSVRVASTATNTRQATRQSDSYYFVIQPPMDNDASFQDDFFNNNNDFIVTPLGPLAQNPLQREQPNLGLDIYSFMGISGATGCCLTHGMVIPLDVVKTRTQVDPENASGNLLQGAKTILQKEGFEGLLLGSQATLVGYLWYGLSVYPSYAFFKRFLSHSVLSPAMATIQSNNVALLAGALSAVVACIGLAPIEAARIRVVADPTTYKPKGLVGTLGTIAQENVNLPWWKSLYAGLPSLLTRQVIFGSIKFLAFEKACEAIYGSFPVLHEASWTSLTVSLMAGCFAGALSSVVSQPADSVLTFMAQDDDKGNLGVVEGYQTMIRQEGIGSLFRGLGSRCLWAGCIIGGQFLLYDVFRQQFGVSSDDLTQVFQIVIPTVTTGVGSGA